MAKRSSYRKALRSTVKKGKSVKKSYAKAAKKASKLYAKTSSKLNKWQARRQKKAQRRIVSAAKKVSRTRLREYNKTIKAGLREKARHEANVAGAERSFAAAIINSYRIRAGLKPVYGEQMLDLARKLIAQKIKSVGFLRSGWIEAREAIKKTIHVRGSSLGGLKQGGPRGYAIPAKLVMSGVVVGEIGSTVPTYKRKGGKNFPNPPSRAWTGDRDDPMPYLNAGLQVAVNEVKASMEAKLVERLGRDWRAITG